MFSEIQIHEFFPSIQIYLFTIILSLTDTETKAVSLFFLREKIDLSSLLLLDHGYLLYVTIIGNI